MRVNTMLFAGFVAICLGKTIADKMPEPPPSQGTAVIDGPYVLYHNDSVSVIYIQDSAGSLSVRKNSMPVSQKGSIELQVNSDISGKPFTVKLKAKLANEKPEHSGVKKMLVVSDIEGNLAALRKLLVASKVIDENLNWTFGKDHVVFTGDFVDRGTMVMEVLWFIYALEAKAQAAGGYVHFILGNHEIMNMSNDLRYVHPRYITHAALMNKPYMQLYGPDTEIGRWLATKNVVEKIGNVLFAHAGISGDVNRLSMNLKELNKIARPYYTDTAYKYKDERLDVIYSDNGPFWYRGYYAAPKATIQQVDSTLDIYRVRHIATGHTIVGKEISSLYEGKLFNTDVQHADGHSEALLIDNGIFWRITPAGEQLAVISR